MTFYTEIDRGVLLRAARTDRRDVDPHDKRDVDPHDKFDVDPHDKLFDRAFASHTAEPATASHPAAGFEVEIRQYSEECLDQMASVGLPTYSLTYLLTHLPTYLLTYLLTYSLTSIRWHL